MGCYVILADQGRISRMLVDEDESPALAADEVEAVPVDDLPELAARPTAAAVLMWSEVSAGEYAATWHDPRTLAQIKADHWAAMKAARDAHEFGWFEWDGSTFDSDRESQARIMGAVQMAVLAMSAQQPFEIAWTLADNSVRTLAGADMVAVGLELGAHVAAAHAIGRTLRAAIEDAETAAEVEAVQWA